jgi:hypothetical protein
VTLKLFALPLASKFGETALFLFGASTDIHLEMICSEMGLDRRESIPCQSVSEEAGPATLRSGFGFHCH